jgi:hypothetical protein
MKSNWLALCGFTLLVFPGVFPSSRAIAQNQCLSSCVSISETFNTAACYGYGKSYSATYYPNTSYVWTATGGTITSGQGTNNVSVVWTSMTGTSLSVQSMGLSCNMSCTYTVDCRPCTPSMTCPLSNWNGPTEVCPDTSRIYKYYHDWCQGPGFGISIYLEVQALGGTIVQHVYNQLLANMSCPTPRADTIWVKWGINPTGIRTRHYYWSVGCGPVDTVRVKRVGFPMGPNPVCVGSNATYTANGRTGSVFDWSLTNGNLNSGQGTGTIQTDWPTVGTGQVQLIYSDPGCPLDTNALAITVTNPLPAPTISGPDTLCNSGTATYSVPNQSGHVYAWTVTGAAITAGQSTSSITVNATTSASFTVQVSDVAGTCSSTAQKTVVNNFPYVSFSNFTFNCFNSTRIYTTPSLPGCTYNWTALGGQVMGGQGTNTVTVKWNRVGRDTLRCTATRGTCTNTVNNTQWTGYNSFQPLGPDTALCGGSITLNAGSPLTGNPPYTSYAWSPAGSSQSLVVSVPGTYSYLRTDYYSYLPGNSCTFRDTIIVLPPTPAPVNLGANQVLCPNGTVLLDAGPGYSSYLWSTGATTQAISVNTAGSYWVAVTQSGYCSGRDTVTVNNSNINSFSLGPNVAICPGTSTTLNAGGGYASYLWSTGASTPSIMVSAAGLYWAEVVDASGCLKRDSITVTFLPSPLVYLGPNDSICPDTFTVLTCNAASSYLWSNGATTQSITVNVAGTYSVTATNSNGCTGSDAITISISSDCVWPGDANHDGVADNQDLLAIGIAWGGSGPIRPNASPSWYGQPCAFWSQSLPSGGANYKHPDCDGNGLVDWPDTLLIHTNYGLTHNKANDINAGTPLFIVPNQDSFLLGTPVGFDLHWGTPLDYVSNGHGLAFTLHVDPFHVTPGSMFLHFGVSFLGTGSPDLLTFTHPMPAIGDVHFGLSRHDGSDHSGSGVIGHGGFLPDSVHWLTNSLGYVPVRLYNVAAVNSLNGPILVAPQDDSIFVYRVLTSREEALTLEGWQVYPVPASGQAVLEIDLHGAANIQSWVTDVQGKKVMELLEGGVIDAGLHRFPIPVRSLSSGMYFVRLGVDGRLLTKKLLVEH